LHVFFFIRPSKNFVSQLVASAHSLREFKLPSGEDHRLRFVQPWSPSDTKTLLENDKSPFVVPAQERGDILVYSGGMPRAVHSFTLRPQGKSVEAVAVNLRLQMYQDCYTSWWSKLKESQQTRLYHLLLSMVLGQQAFDADSKQMYDRGLVKRHGDLCVKPVNRLAENVLYDLYSTESPTHALPLSSEPNDTARGINFEQQVNHSLTICFGILFFFVRVVCVCCFVSLHVPRAFCVVF
jgi:hypothetical protein